MSEERHELPDDLQRRGLHIQDMLTILSRLLADVGAEERVFWSDVRKLLPRPVPQITRLVLVDDAKAVTWMQEDRAPSRAE